MQTIDQVCLNTAASKARGYRALLTSHQVLFCVCFMGDILKEDPVLDAFHSFHSRNMPIPIDIRSGHGVENAKAVCFAAI